MSSIDGMRGSGSAKGHLHVVACFRIRVVPHQRLAHQLAQRDVEHRGQEQAEHRSEEHTSELQSLMRNSYAVFCLKKKITQHRDYTLPLNSDMSIDHAHILHKA